MERNVRTYPAFVAANSALPWLPVFFLFFTERVGVDDAMRLGAIYYLSVVLFEVSSGILSDRVGRRITLLIACSSLLFASVGFVFAESWWSLLSCQVLLAAGIAFQSGSDSALLFDSLKSLEREHEYEEWEARARTVSQFTLTVSCLAGGLLGSIDLRLPYVMAGFAAASAFVLVYRMCEPVSGKQMSTAPLAGRQAAVSDLTTAADERPGVANALRQGMSEPVLRWTLMWYILAFSLAHVPYEFYQPWIRLLGDTDVGAFLAAGDRTPILAGVTAALSMLCGAFAAMLSMTIHRRLGLSTLLLTANVVQLIIIAGLAVVLHPALLILVLARSFAMSMTHAPLMAAIAPRLHSVHRATWLSIQSLFGRLGFAVVLLGVSGLLGEQLPWSDLRRLLLILATAGAVLAIVVWIKARPVIE